MEKYKQLTWPAALLIIAVAYYIHEIPLHERLTAFKVFGEYTFPSNNVELDLNINRWYSLIKDDASYLSGGTFEVRADTIVLTDIQTKRKMYLLYESEEKLVALKVDSIPPRGKLLCSLKVYPDGEIKFTGWWRNGEKHGAWRYFDQHGNRTRVIEYP